VCDVYGCLAAMLADGNHSHVSIFFFFSPPNLGDRAVSPLSRHPPSKSYLSLTHDVFLGLMFETAGLWMSVRLSVCLSVYPYV